MPAQPNAKARQGGGFNQGFGDFSDEHLDENALQQASVQHQLGQQGSNPGQTSKSQHQLPGQSHPPPRQEMGSLWDELVKEPVKDIVTGLLSLADFSQALGFAPPETKSPEEKAKMQQTHARYQQLNQEQQAVAQKIFQQKQQKRKQEEEEKARIEQQKKQKEAQSVVMPSSPEKGPAGPTGSGKQRAVTKLEQDRKMLSGPASAN